MAARGSLQERFNRRVIEIDGHLLWTGASNGRGYGTIGLGGQRGKIEYAHRVAYFLSHGEWPPPGIDGHHRCPNKLCVREHPDHVVFITHAEHMREDPKVNGTPRRTHCLRGHALTEENTLIWTRTGKNYPKRLCRTCRRAIEKVMRDRKEGT